jgi:hypothetical protein
MRRAKVTKLEELKAALVAAEAALAAAKAAEDAADAAWDAAAWDGDASAAIRAAWDAWEVDDAVGDYLAELNKSEENSND